MKRYVFSLLTSVILISCGSKNAVTNRSQSLLVTESQMQSMAISEYKQFLDSAKVVNGTADAAMVKRVGTNIANAITKYYADQGKGDIFKGFSWEYNLVQSNEANAWCMPGGKIVVYTGILPLTQNENALAVVLGHEIAHAVAEHGRERMDGEVKRQLGGQLLSVLLASNEKTAQTRNIFLSAYDVGSQLGYTLPHSRSQESEADRLGLTYCALAGYDPQAAISFWQRMQSAGGGQRPPEFLSTHPAEENRIKQLQEQMPEAVKIYQQNKK